MPSPENIERICNDCKSQLYDNYYFNFITPISRDMLEKMANAAVACNCVSQISKVSLAAFLELGKEGVSLKVYGVFLRENIAITESEVSPYDYS